MENNTIPFLKTRSSFPKFILGFFFFCILLSSFIIPSKLFAETKDPEPPVETDEVLIVLYVKNLGTCEIPAAIRDQDIYLPVVDVFNFLKIRTVSGNGFDMISGFFVDPKNVYQIDRANKIIIYQGKNYALRSSDIIVTETNLYLKAKYFDQIFGLECKFNFRALTISMKSNLELPAIRELRLEQMHSNFDRLRGNMKADTTIARAYPLFHFGMADWSINANQVVNGINTTRLNLGLGAILAGGELNSLLLYNANQPFLEKQQFYQWRYANNENQALRQIILGKIAASPVSSVFYPVVGLQFTNAPTINRKSFGTYTLSDNTQPNWTVELYVNGVLIDYVKADASGFFTFDVPLIYGSTDVTLRYYGPWGEELSSKQNFTIPFNFLPPKEMEYKVSSGIIEDDKNSLFGQAKMNYGVTKSFTFGGGLEYNSSIAASKNIAFFNTSLRLASNILFNGEYVYGIRYKGLLTYHLPTNLQVELYYSKYNPAQDAVKLNYTEERKLMISQPFHLINISALSRLTVSQNLLEHPLTDLPPTKYTIPEFSLSGTAHGISANISTSAFIIDNYYTTVFSDASISTTLPAGILFTPQIRFDYKLNEITIVKYSLEKRFIKYGVINASYQYNFSTGSPIYQLGFRYDFSRARVGFSALQSNNTNSISEFASGSLIYQPQINYRDFNVNTNVGRGGLIFIPFLDINNNGKKDANEPKVSGLNILVSGGGIQKRNNDTTIVISGLEPYTNYFVEVDANSFENMAWKIIKPKMNIAIEPNKLKLIEIPVAIAGEVSGTVYIKKQNEEKGLGRILVCFYTTDSVLINKTLTEQDGYFSFLGLLPGSYYAAIEMQQLNKLQMVSVPSFIPFKIKGGTEGDVVDGLKFILQSKSKGAVVPIAEKQIVSKTDNLTELAQNKLLNKEPQINTVNPPQISDTLKTLLPLMVKKQTDSLKQANKQPEIKTVNPPQISDTLKTLLALMVKKQADSIKSANLNPIVKTNPIVISNTSSGPNALAAKKHSDSLLALAKKPEVKEINPPQTSETVKTPSTLIVNKQVDSLKQAKKQAKTNIAENLIIDEKGSFAVQARAHSQLSDAQAAQIKLSKIFKQPVVIVKEGGLYKVRIDGFNSHDEAASVIPKLTEAGYAGAFVINPSKNETAPVNIIESPVIKEKGNVAIQVRANRKLANAKEIQSKLNKIFKQPVIITQEGDLFKVRITGVKNLEKAAAMLVKLAELGYNDAFIMSPGVNPGGLKTGAELNKSNEYIHTDHPPFEVLLEVLSGKIKSDRPLSPAELNRIEETVVTNNDVLKRSKFGDKPIYSIQIAKYENGLPQKSLAVVLKLNTQVESYTNKKDGLTRYFTGSFASYNKALKYQTELIKKGFKNPSIIVIDKGRIIPASDYKKQKK